MWSCLYPALFDQTISQDFHKPFDAPAVLVVGHQTNGKSALIEALMGFQFNQVLYHKQDLSLFDRQCIFRSVVVQKQDDLWPLECSTIRDALPHYAF